MGRYYSGDIEGKFWFAVQNSDAGERFGCEPREPGYIEYYTEDLEKAKQEVENIKRNLGDWLPKLDKFFNEQNGYNDDMLLEAGFPEDKIETLVMEYADLKLGEQIVGCLEKQGCCEFQAEL